jgi:hypothetical protein
MASTVESAELGRITVAIPSATHMGAMADLAWVNRFPAPEWVLGRSVSAAVAAAVVAGVVEEVVAARVVAATRTLAGKPATGCTTASSPTLIVRPASAIACPWIRGVPDSRSAGGVAGGGKLR